MRALRYGVTAEWVFNGFDLPTSQTVEQAYLTIKKAWAGASEEQAPDDPNLLMQLAGTILEPQDGEGNWVVSFEFTLENTTTDLAPPPKFLWYEVTLQTEDEWLRPVVGQLRMLSDVFTVVV